MNSSVSQCKYVKTIPPKNDQIYEQKNNFRTSRIYLWISTNWRAITYCGYMDKLRASGGQPTITEGILMVTADIKKWWGKVGVELKHTETIKWMIRNIVDDYNDLKKENG